MADFKHRVMEESEILIPTIIYFWIAFSLIHFTQGLLLREGVQRYYTYLDVTIGAIVVSFILVIINTLSFMNIFHHKPLVFNIAWKFFVYSVAVLIFRILEYFVYHLYHSHDLPTALFKIKLVLSSPIFWAIEMWLVLVFFIYASFNEFGRAVGRDKIRALLFG